jgi:hypothetical protein
MKEEKKAHVYNQLNANPSDVNSTPPLPGSSPVAGPSCPRAVR